MTESRGQRLNIVVGESGPPPASSGRPGGGGASPTGRDGEPRRAARPYLGVHFQCCGVYSRVTLARTGDRYAGACPKCFRPVVFRIGPGGTDSRFFTVS